MDKMREEFEKWLDKGNHCGCNENMWKAWQAARTVPEGFVMVPVEPTDAMREVRTWDFNRFYPPSEIWKAMLAAAPEGKQ